MATRVLFSEPPFVTPFTETKTSGAGVANDSARGSGTESRFNKCAVSFISINSLDGIGGVEAVNAYG